MADEAVVGAQADDDEIFVYMGGDQVVPMDIRRVRIHKSVKIIRERAFYGRQRLIYVEFHDGIERVGEDAFCYCYSLCGPIRLLGVKIIEKHAFYNCAVTDVEFGDKLETIEAFVFNNCRSLRSLTMPSVRSIDRGAFSNCIQLTDLELPEGLETIQEAAFHRCNALRRIAIPLNCMIGGDDVFSFCPKLTTVALVGGIHKTVASLHLERWRNEMNDEMNRINQTLPNRHAGKTPVIQEWISSVIHRIEHYEAEHKALLKEATTLLELALWKAKIDVKEEKESFEGIKAKKVKLDTQSERRELRITSGANIVIKNVLPFLELK